MKTFFYALRRATKLRLSNFLKIFTLAIGILVGAVLLCRVAFYASFDDYSSRYDDTYFLCFNWEVVDDEQKEEDRWMHPRGYAIMAPTLKEEIPTIDNATRWGRRSEALKSGDKELMVLQVITDIDFTHIFAREVLAGSMTDALSTTSGFAISRSTAEAFFGSVQSAVGQRLTDADNRAYTVGAVFEDFPANSYHYSVDVLRTENFSTHWYSDGYFIFFTTDGGVDTQILKTEIEKVFTPHINASEYLKNHKLEVEINHIDSFSKFADYGDADAGSLNYIAVIIALVLIVIAALNFALMQINSLVSRYKEVGVHKVSGATTWQIFMLVFYETFFAVLFAVILAIVLGLALRTSLESLVGPFEHILALRHFWMVGVVLLVVVVIAGLLPAALFSRISATSVFRAMSPRNIWWKQSLLFVQLMATTIVAILTIAIALQFRYMMTLEMGYNYDNLSTIQLRKYGYEQRITLKEELLKLSEVQSATLSQSLPIYGMIGTAAHRMGETDELFRARLIKCDSDYFKTYGIEILEGDLRDFSPEKGFVSTLTSERLGTTIEAGEYLFEGSEIVGVAEQIRQHVYSGQHPLFYCDIAQELWQSEFLTIRTASGANGATVAMLQERGRQILGDTELEVVSYAERLELLYYLERGIRDGFLLGAVVLIVIMLVGIMSYISTEVKRSRRQIVMRRTYGATVGQIVVMVGRRLFVITGITALLAIPVCYYILQLAFSQFYDKIELSWWIFGLGILFILGIVVLITYAQCLKIATRDYKKIIGKI